MVLEKAVDLDYIPQNPAAGCALPQLEQKEIRPLDDQQVAALLAAARGGELEHLVTVALFTGLRLSELLGLTWDVVDFKRGTIQTRSRPGWSTGQQGCSSLLRAARPERSPPRRPQWRY